MTSSQPPPIQSATHVVFDPFMSDRLASLGATNVVRVLDHVVIGPSRRDGREHAQARAGWWGPSEEEWDRLYSPDVRWQPPVVVWVAGRPVERMDLWRTCSWLRDLGISHRDVLILDMEPAPRRVPRRGPFDCSDMVCDHPDAVLLERLEKARPWTRERYDRAVSLWEQFVDADFSRFARTCARGLKAFPDLAPVWALLSSFIPRVTSNGSLRLSRFDALVLDILSDEWKTAVKVYVDNSNKGESLREFCSCVGDLFLARRLHDWASHGAYPPVERAPGPRPDVEMNAFVYRLTEPGMRIRKQGLAALTDAPSLPIAGIGAYAPESPWVLRDDGKLARR